MVTLVVDNQAVASCSDASTRFFAAVDKAVSSGTGSCVAFDCEGIDLSRAGTLEIISICFQDEKDVVYLVDVGSNGSHRGSIVGALKRLFECDSVGKVIHDCRMDSDALYHHLGIELKNVHDTSCYHRALTFSESNLNDTLQYNSLSTNLTRDNSVYKRNPTFWATRPLTDTMIQWASADVSSLLELADKQTRDLNDSQSSTAKKNSIEFAQTWKMKFQDGLECRVNIGHFIGRRGCNIRSLQNRSGTIIYQHNNRWMVFYSDENGLTQVRRALGHK